MIHNHLKKRNIYLIGVLKKEISLVCLLRKKGDLISIHVFLPCGTVIKDHFATIERYCSKNVSEMNPHTTQNKVSFVRLSNQCSKLIRETMIVSFWYSQINSGYRSYGTICWLCEGNCVQWNSVICDIQEIRFEKPSDLLLQVMKY